MVQIMGNRSLSLSSHSLEEEEKIDLLQVAKNAADDYKAILRTNDGVELISRLRKLAANRDDKFLPDLAVELRFDRLALSQNFKNSYSFRPDINLLANGQLVIWNEPILEIPTPRGVRYVNSAKIYDSHTKACYELNTTLQMHGTESYIDNTTFINNGEQIRYASVAMHLFNGSSLTFPTTNWQMPTDLYPNDIIIPLNSRYSIVNLEKDKLSVIDTQNHVVDSLSENVDCIAVSNKDWFAVGCIDNSNIRLYKFNESGNIKLQSRWEGHTYTCACSCGFDGWNFS
jgi:hypothetical protein